MPLNLAITNEEKILVTLNPTTAAGNAATLDGEPTWTVTEGDATVEPQAGGLSAYIVSGSVGASTVTVSADADLDAGENRELTDTIAVNVVGAEAAGLGLTMGTAEPK
jgi:hypothetical protein